MTHNDDLALARSLASMCNQCETRPRNPGHLLCYYCYSSRTRCARCRITLPIRSGLTFCYLCEESDEDNPPSEDASYEETLAWEKRRMEKKSDPFFTSLLDAFPSVCPTTEEITNATQCPICLETYKIDDKVVTITCMHRFHHHCMQEWFAQNKATCPLCLCDVRETDQ